MRRPHGAPSRQARLASRPAAAQSWVQSDGPGADAPLPPRSSRVQFSCGCSRAAVRHQPRRAPASCCCASVGSSTSQSSRPAGSAAIVCARFSRVLHRPSAVAAGSARSGQNSTTSAALRAEALGRSAAAATAARSSAMPCSASQRSSAAPARGLPSSSGRLGRDRPSARALGGSGNQRL